LYNYIALDRLRNATGVSLEAMKQVITFSSAPKKEKEGPKPLKKKPLSYAKETHCLTGIRARAVGCGPVGKGAWNDLVSL
jgi:hypothetical protein